MSSRTDLWPHGCHAPPGLPGSSTDLSTRAAPSYPGELDGCSCSLLHHSIQASPHSEGWPLSLCVTRPCWGSLALRLMSLPREAAPAELPRPAPAWLQCSN